jgi:anti-sigma factor RsiW
MFRPAGPDPLSLVVDAHVRSLQAGHLEDVASTDRHTVKPWFEGKLDFAPPVKDLADRQFPLTGGRLDVMEGRPVAAMVYRHGTHPINLLAWPAPSSPDRDPVTEDARGFTAIHWVQNGMTLWAVSDLERSQLEEFVRLWRAAS